MDEHRFNIDKEFILETAGKVVMGLLFLLIVVFGVLAVIEGVTFELVGYEYGLPCFDKMGNEIQGVNCTKEIKCGVISKWIGDCER